jgi:hypothetical protein
MKIVRKRSPLGYSRVETVEIDGYRYELHLYYG